MPIITAGIYLPNGVFLPNEGDGHAQNANRFCLNHPVIDKLKDSACATLGIHSDDYMIMSGCAIVASYRGERCLKVAENDENPVIQKLIECYRKAGYVIMPFWSLVDVYKNEFSKVLYNEPKMQIISIVGVVQK